MGVAAFQEEMNRNQDGSEDFRAFLDLLPQLAWTCWPDGKYDYFNAQWTNYTGVPPENLVGMQWRETLHPDDRVATCEYWYAALRGEVPYDLEYRIRRSDGEYRWFRTRANPLKDSSGQIVRWYGTCTDIHDMKELQQRLAESEASQRLILEGARDFAIFSTDPTGAIRLWNPGAERVFGFSPEEVIGRNTRMLFTPEDQTAGEPERELEQARTKGCAMDERWHLRKGGDRFFASGTMRPLIGADGTLRGFLKVARDITPRKEQEDTLEKTVGERTAQLRETVQELQAFSYSIAHDLRAPLRAMQGFASILLEESGGLREPQVAYLGHIVRAANRLDALITDVLNYTRTARASAPLGKIDLDRLVRDVIATYSQFQPPHAKVTIDGNLPHVMGNEALLTQCVSNLLSNAVKFVPAEREPTVRLWAEQPKPNHDPGKVRICFADNGVGIAPEHRHRIFNLFERLTPSERVEGTGIGLAIVRKAVERMGGDVGFESGPGRGSVFWLELQKAE